MWADDPTSKPFFAYEIQNDLYVVVRHRNHADIMSSAALPKGANGYTWDFTTAITKAYNSGQKQLSANEWGMVAGDTDVNGQISDEDRTNTWGQRNRLKYRLRDVNFDGKVDLGDRIKVWNNRGFNVPIQ